LADVTQDGILIAHYDYDANGNRLSVTRPSGGMVSGTYDAQDRLTAYGAVSYTYNANGDLLTSTSGTEITAYTYDVFGNLSSVALPNGTQIEYVIDGQNRRIGKKVNGTLTQGFLYSGQLRPVAELDGSGNVVSRFVYGTKINVPEYMVKGGVTYRIITDHLGSVRLVVDTGTGAIAQRLDYDEFGQVRQDTNPGFQPFGYAGGNYDLDTKLVRFGFRDYDAFTGRWTTKDPIRFAGGPNTYGYVQNSPIESTDPLGLIEWPLDAPMPWNDNPNWPTQGPLPEGPYDYSRRTRQWGQQTYPGEIGKGMRHCVVSCLVAARYGTTTTRAAGAANEVQGFVMWDLPNLGSRLRGKTPWAASWRDLQINESGIKCARGLCGGQDEASLRKACTECCQKQY
jgi:RHS repeat-associated protein